MNQARSTDRALPEVSTRGIEYQFLMVVAASLFVALCAHVALPLPFTPVPLSLGNFAVLLCGLLLGSRRGAAVLVLYLFEGAAGLPVFAPGLLPGVARFAGPTAGFLLAYPLIAYVAGRIFERGARSYARALTASITAEALLFACGVSWLMLVARMNIKGALLAGLVPFLPGEVLKTFAAAGIAGAWQRMRARG